MQRPQAGPEPLPAKQSPLAIAALISALSSYLCLWGIGGLFAVSLGLLARSEIRSSHGRLTGARMAGAALALGLLNLVLTASAVVALGHYWSERKLETPLASATPPPSPLAPRPDPAMGLTQGHFSEDTQVRTLQIGHLTLIDVGPEVDSLDDELTRQRRLAAERHVEVVVWVVAPRCSPCNGVSAALADPLMQKALSTARLVRIDRTRFAAELAQLGIPHSVIPGFARLDSQNRPLDYIHGGEWDEDIAPNIAPVLGEFVRGTYKARREPWRGIKRRDETAL